MAKVLFKWDYSKYPGAKKFPHLFQTHPVGTDGSEQDCLRGNGRQPQQSRRFCDGCGCGLPCAAGQRALWAACASCRVFTWTPDRKVRVTSARPLAGMTSFIPGLKRLADAIHSQKANCRLSAHGLRPRRRRRGALWQRPVRGPQRLRIFRPMHEMSKDDIKLMIKQHLDSARRGLEAGFDVMEISGIVGYLISNSSPATRTEEKTNTAETSGAE